MIAGHGQSFRLEWATLFSIKATMPMSYLNVRMILSAERKRFSSIVIIPPWLSVGYHLVFSQLYDYILLPC